ncbi:GtrA family protein [Janthinobacterium fluminis]|uniref:GtrA family protein n=1 Tax=Janthinobacterium fluminis TaxID=2987524 RepID=A0ABT5K776_9BURK|nr:GtrA family protein [Janthinobacterium fluminis]MDC8760848.1 GtrA family protein [Janthinobacterium fluminis]
MRFLKYAVTQVGCFIVDFVAFAAFLHMSQSPAGSNALAKVLSGLLAFYIHRHYTFADRQEQQGRQAGRYIALWAINIPFTSAMVELINMAIGIPYVAKIGSDGISFCLNYLISKKFIFNSSGK